MQLDTATDSDYTEFASNIETGLQEVGQMLDAAMGTVDNSVFVQIEFILSLMKSLQYLVSAGDAGVTSKAIQHIISKLNTLKTRTTNASVSEVITKVLNNMNTMQSSNTSSMQNGIAKIRKDLGEVIRKDRIFIKISNIEFLLQYFQKLVSSGNKKKQGGCLKQVLWY